MASTKHLNVAMEAPLLARFKAEARKRGLKVYAALAQAIRLWLTKPEEG